MNLAVVIPVSVSDLRLCVRNLEWMGTLGKLPLNLLLLVFAADVPKPDRDRVQKAAELTFTKGEIVSTPFALPDQSWPMGSNWLFETAAKHIAARYNRPWLWLPPNAVPMRRGWLVAIESLYAQAKRPFMGRFIEPDKHGSAQTLMGAVGVYPGVLSKFILQRLISKRQTDFEQSCAELIVPEAYNANTFWTVPFDGERTVFDAGAVAALPKRAEIVHSNGASSLLDVLTGKKESKTPEPAIEVEQPTPKPEPAKPAIKALPMRHSAYYHSGNLGDIIYGLCAIKLAGGGKMVIGPKQRHTSPAGNPVNGKQYEMLRPLLEAQPYITGTTYTSRHPGTDNAFDLNRFRNDWDSRELRQKTNINTLVRMHCHTLGVLELFNHKELWLSVKRLIPTGLFIVHRSDRYRNDEFPWAMAVKRLGHRMLFMGLPDEHRKFQLKFGAIGYWKPKDFLEMASVIAGAAGFIGNQSFPCSLALGLGQRVCQESWPASPDCVFKRGNFLTQPFTEGQLDAWASSKL